MVSVGGIENYILIIKHPLGCFFFYVMVFIIIFKNNLLDSEKR